MAEGYCMYHHNDLSREDVERSKCRKKENSNEPCRHFIDKNKQKYRNDTNHIARKRGG